MDGCYVLSLVPFYPFDRDLYYFLSTRGKFPIRRDSDVRAMTNDILVNGQMNEEMRTTRTILFFIAASAFASAFASFLALSFSSFDCASRLSVPTFACKASETTIRSLTFRIRGNQELTVRVISIEKIGMFFF